MGIYELLAKINNLVHLENNIFIDENKNKYIVSLFCVISFNIWKFSSNSVDKLLMKSCLSVIVNFTSI